MAKDTMKFYATGRRKTAIARVWLFPGEGTITINRRDAEAYLNRATVLKLVEQPLMATGTRRLDAVCSFRSVPRSLETSPLGTKPRWRQGAWC